IYINYSDSSGSFTLRGRVDSLTVPMAFVRLKQQDVQASGLFIGGADLDMALADGPTDDSPPDTARWKFDVAAVELSQVNFRMSGTAGTLEAGITSARIDNGAVSLEQQTVDADKLTLDSAYYHYSPPPPRESREENPGEPSPPWVVRVGSVELNDNTARYTAAGRDFTVPVRSRTGRFDAGDIGLTGFDLQADSVYNRGGDIRLYLSTLSFTESSGLEVREAFGGFAMDSAGIRLSDFRLKTVGSQVRADLTAGGDFLQGDATSPLSGEINAGVSADELLMFIDAGNLGPALHGKTLTVDGTVSGTLAALQIRQLHAGIPGMADLTAEGTLSSVTDPSHLGGQVTFRGTTGDLRAVRSLIPDSTLRSRLDIPSGMSVYGQASFSPGRYSPDITIRIDTGSLHIRGDFDTRTENYTARLEAAGFPVDRFLPYDSLGVATLTLDAAGSGFDPLVRGTAADISLDIDRFDYYNFPYRDITLDALLDGGHLSGELHSANRPLSVDLNLAGQIADTAYTATVDGRIGNADLTALGLSASPLAIAGILDAGVTVYPDTAYLASVTLDTVRVNYGERTETVSHAEIDARAGLSGVALTALTGNLNLDFTTAVPLDSISASISAASAELRRQLDARSLDMAALQAALPPLELELHGGSGNILHSLLLDCGYGFNRLDITASTTADEPFRAAVVANGFQTSGITLDTLNVWMRRNDDRLEYALRLRNRPGNIEQMALVVARGYAEGNKAEINILQRNRQDSVGFRFGLDAELLDSAVTVTLIPENPVFGYRPWTVNSGNYFTYDFDRELYADMRLDGDGEHVYIVSAPFDGFPRGAVKMDMEGIDIGTTLELLPGPPPLGGTLSTDLLFGMAGDMLALDGSVEVDSARWDGRPIGDVALKASFRSDSTGGTLDNVAVRVDGAQVLTGQGSIGAGNTDVRAALTSFPLTAIDPFLPEDALQADGTADGELALSQKDGKTVLDGRLGFSDAGITVPAVGTRYTLPTEELTFAGSVIDFHNWQVTAPNGQPLTIDGTVDLSDLSDPGADLDVTARNFEAVNSERRGGSQVYGRALTDIDITAAGRLDALRVRGNISVLTGTDITYTLPDDDLDIDDRSQDIVTFVSFADTAAVFLADSAALLRVWGMDMLVNIDIKDNVKATVNISTDGNNRAELTGDGNLTFSMNTQGDSRFTGRYNLSGGTVVYHPPVISAKTFTVNDGSYVDWTGEIADPAFNVTAAESVSATVTSDDGTSRSVTFDLTVSLKGTLKDMELVFDLSSPNDITIQNQLQTLSADQRSQQALALLIYNTYTGPGTTAKVDVNNPLNSFIEKQLNQWARNSLPGVDLAFGINSVDDSATGGGEHTDYSYRVSKSLFDDRVKVTVGGSINPEASTNDNLRDNFVDDISLEYRLSNRDNMFLKAYRYNTQESILEGEVTETGFGFVARKSMNKLKELFRLRRSPEQKALRRSRREVKQQVRQNERSAGVDPAKEQRQDDPLSLDNSPQEATTRRDDEDTTTGTADGL
ncbi:MAG: translocation/assembly module TamB domain-containing protein, partial [Alistipes sp.]|nr:translocation/assembly module TamB domain-containing protein [Alistipes sp.]